MGNGDQQFIVMMIPHSATSKGGKGNPPLGEADGLLVHLHQGPDIPTPDGEHLLRHRPPGLPERGLGQAGWRDPEASTEIHRWTFWERPLRLFP